MLFLFKVVGVVQATSWVVGTLEAVVEVTTEVEVLVVEVHVSSSQCPSKILFYTIGC